MAESILVTGKRISSMELVSNVTGDEKIPTGQPEDLAITPNQIADHTILRGDLASQEDISQVEVNLTTQIDAVELEVANQSSSIRALLDAETQARLSGDDALQASIDALEGGSQGLRSDLEAEIQARIAADDLKVDKAGSVKSVAGRTGDVVLSPADIGYPTLANLDTRNKEAQYVIDSRGITQQQINNKLYREVVSVRDFGALGNGDQTLISVPAYKTGRDKSYTITQQTVDGHAFNEALRYLRSIGGGALYVPPAENGKSYRVYAYLEVIDFPCVIYGAGAPSLIKNCDSSPTNTNGYGIFVIQPQNGEEITLLNFKVDGSATVRAKPTSELQLYPLVVYGYPKLRAFGVSSVDSPIDCLNISLDSQYKNYDVFATIVSCYFDNCFRNTVTVSRGENIKFSDCVVRRGGWVYGGTQPRYCVDIEPNVSSTIVSTQWVNCTFSHGYNVLVGGVWSDSTFTGCVFDGSVVYEANIDRPNYPWLFQMTAGRWDVDNCKFIGRKDYMRNQCHHYNAYSPTHGITDDSYLRIKNSSFIHAGLISTGRSISIENCLAQLSMCPFLFQGGTQPPKHDVFIKNLRLVNVFDGANIGTGTTSSLAVATSILGMVDIDGLTCEVDSSSLGQIPTSLFSTAQTQYGIWIPNAVGANGNRCVVKNVHCEGYYNRLHTYLGIAKSTSQRRDWGNPNLPPANTMPVNSTITGILTSTAVTGTLTDGTVTNNSVANKAITGTVTNGAVTGTAVQSDGVASRTLGGRTTPFYLNCTMWGDYN